MQKYKLLKDLPRAKAGEIVFLDEGDNLIYQQDDDSCATPLAYTKIDEISEWLEEIKEPKSVWDLQEGDKYYCIDSQGFIGTGEWKNNLGNISERKNGNVFLNIDEAEKECDRRNAIGKIQQYCWENSIDNTWNGYIRHYTPCFNKEKGEVTILVCSSKGKSFSPLGYFSYDDAKKILEQFPEELKSIYS